MTGFRTQTLRPNDIGETTYALPEKTKRGPPTNKNIPVRNMDAQIANMSLNENNGFKNEYHVRYTLSSGFIIYHFNNIFFFCLLYIFLNC